MSHRPPRSLTIVVSLIAFCVMRPTGALTQDVLVGRAGGGPFLIDNVTVTEGDGGAVANTEIKVSLREALTNSATVSFATVNGTATGGSCGTAGADYATTSGALTFTANTSGLAIGSSLTLTIPVCGDDLREGNEQFTVRLSSPLMLANALGAATITDNEPLPALSITPKVQVKEPSSGQAPAVFTVTLRGPRSAQTVTVQIATAPGTASAGTRCSALLPTDYVTQTRTLTFSPNSDALLTSQIQTVRTQQIEVPVCGKRPLKEPEETFFVTLSRPGNAVLVGAEARGMATIVP